MYFKHWKKKEKKRVFTLEKKKRKKQTKPPAETMTDADYLDDLVLLANAPAQAESLLHSLEHAAGG